MLKTFDTLDAIPEAQRASAIERKDGKFLLEEVDPNAISTVAQTTIDKLRKEKKEEKERADAAQTALDEAKAAADAAGKGVTREALDEINKNAENKFKPVVDENATLKAENRKLKLTDRVRALALDAGIMPGWRIDKAMKDLADRIELSEDGDGFVIKDAKGKVTAETVDAFLKTTYKTEAPGFYAGPGGSGSGAEGSVDSGGTSDYDPKAEGKKMADAQKRTTEERALARK